MEAHDGLHVKLLPSCKKQNFQFHLEAKLHSCNKRMLYIKPICYRHINCFITLFPICNQEMQFVTVIHLN